jgi:pimeloyl-ACP methyl ester carboxylesterase
MHKQEISIMNEKIRRFIKPVALGLSAIVVVALLVAGGAIASLLHVRSMAQSLNAGMDRIVDPGGIDERELIVLGSVRQWITVRALNRNNPILLYLHGGPGSPVSDVSYLFQRPWEDFFTVVQWDQRGFGRSALDQDKLRDTVNREQVISDAIELIEYLRKRFDQQKVVLVGQSWGTVLGASVSKRRPDLVHAYVSIGQVVEWEGNFAETKRLLTERAASTGDAQLQQELAAIGPAPDSRDHAAYSDWIDRVQSPMSRLGYSWHNAQGGKDSLGSRVVVAALLSNSVSHGELFRMLFAPPSEENARKGMLQSLVGWKFERDVGKSLPVPTIFAAGRYDWQTPVTLIDQLYTRLCNTPKAIVHFEHSAHVVVAEESGRMMKLLLDYALPAATGAPVQGLVNEPCSTAADADLPG